MKVFLVLALLLIINIPLINIVLLHVFKSLYRPKIIFIIHLMTFVIPPMLWIYYKDYALAFFLIDISSFFILYIGNKIYCRLYKAILTNAFYNIFESPVISEIYQVKNKLYSRTREGYVLIDLNNETYNVCYDIDCCDINDKNVFKKLKSIKTF